jgi:phosphate transport system permease protein
MSATFLLLVLVALTAVAFAYGRARAMALAPASTSSNKAGAKKLHSLPAQHGALVALWAAIPAGLALLAWIVLAPSLGADSEAALGSWLRAAVVVAIGVAGVVYAASRITPELRARNHVEVVVCAILFIASAVAVLTTVGIVLSLVFESLRFFALVPPQDFLFGLTWSPQTAIRADQVGSSGQFGAVPVFTGTLLISTIAMAVAAPVGLMAAIYMAEYADEHVRTAVKPVLEILAGVPTVVYGFFAALTVAPIIKSIGQAVGLDVASESALAAGTVMGIMILPFVASISDDVIRAVPIALRHGSMALGATQSETIRKVVFPAALPGIVGGILLAVSRAIGETMIVVMAAGLAARLTANPLEAVTTVTVQIVGLLTGDQEFASAKTLSAFALGLMLFFVTLILNVIALQVVRRYRETYE